MFTIQLIGLDPGLIQITKEDIWNITHEDIYIIVHLLVFDLPSFVEGNSIGSNGTMAYKYSQDHTTCEVTSLGCVWNTCFKHI